MKSLPLIYVFQAKARDDHRVSGLIAASGRFLAVSKIRRFGFTDVRVRLSFHETFNSWFGQKIDHYELAEFYRSVGMQLKNHGKLIEALDSAQDFVLDGRLKSAIAIMRNAVLESENVADAMVMAGLDRREAKLVRALGGSGKHATAFIELAEEIEERYKLTQNLRDLLRKPVLLALFTYAIVTPGMIFGLAPISLRFFERMGNAIEIPTGLHSYFDLVRWANANPMPAIVIWILLGAGAVTFIRSPWFYKLLDLYPTVRLLSQYTDHASVWGAYALLNRAGVRPSDICTLLASAAHRHDTRISLKRMGKRLQQADQEVYAVAKVGFPSWAVAAFKASKTSASLDEELLRRARTFKDTAKRLTRSLERKVELITVLFISLLVFVAYFLVLFPMVGPVLKSL